jgi:hypothetical protein
MAGFKKIQKWEYFFLTTNVRQTGYSFNFLFFPKKREREKEKDVVPKMSNPKRWKELY